MSSSKRLRIGLAGAIALAAAEYAYAVIDLAALDVAPQRGQSAEQARRDRYECHNWAIEQTGIVPQAAPAQAERAAREERTRRAERVERVLNGAAIGAAIGGLIRATRDQRAADGVVAGAAVGAAVGAATAGRRDRAAEGVSDDEAEYLRALSACLEGRGYSVALPDGSGVEEEVVAANGREGDASKSRSAGSIVG